MPTLGVVLGLLVARSAAGAGAVLCQKPNGLVILDTERPNDLDHLSVIQSAPLAPADLNGWFVQVLTTAAINARLSVTASALCLVQE